MIRETNLLQLARWHRRLVWCIPLSFLVLVMAIENAPVDIRQYPLRAGLLAVWLVLYLAIIVVLLRVLGAMGDLRLSLVFNAALMMLPPAAPVALIAAYVRGLRTLRRAGVPAGLWGVTDEDVLRFIEPGRCRHCGYDLTGNVSGRCPECGTIISADGAGQTRRG
ncbi:MAG: hypothetical protein V3T70_11795 [Phycisphaerae bacterium]